MKKKSLALTIAILLIALFVTNSAFAAMPGTGWWTSFTLMNVATTSGQLTLAAYDSLSPTVFNSESFTIAPNQSLAYHPGFAATYPTGTNIGFTSPLPAGFKGSVVVSSSTETVSVVNIGNNPSGTVGVTGGTAASYYQAIGGGQVSQKISFPSVKNNFSGQTTTFYVQSAGASASTTITYKMNDGNTYTQSVVIPANTMFVFDPTTAGVPAGLTAPAATNGSLGAAIVESTSGNVAGVVVEHPHTGSPASFSLSTRGLTSSDMSTKIIAPSLKNNFNGGNTGLSVQNVGTSEALVRLTLTVVNASNPALIGNTYQAQEAIPVGGSTVFSSFRNNLGGMPTGTFAAGIVESITDTTHTPQLLAGVVNETNSLGKAVYYAFADTQATTKIALPLVKEQFNNMTTGGSIMNIGSAPTILYFSYTDRAGNLREFQTTQPLAPGAAIPIYTVNKNLSGRFTGLADFSVLMGTLNSVSIRSDGVQKIVGVAQESDLKPSDGLLDVKNYESFALN